VSGAPRAGVRAGGEVVWVEDQNNGASDDRRSLGEVAGVETEAREASERRGTYSWITWQAAVYVFVLGAACLVLVPLTSLWWVVPVLGALVPIALTVLDGPNQTLRRTDDKKSKERELLNALAERGEITPTTAAMRTSLTVDEASKMLDVLASKGHLNLQAEDGVVAYALPERGRPPAVGAPSKSADTGSDDQGPQARLHDPLSERELEVLALLTSGKTNAEIAKDLFVALGTVKSHVNSIYRKLDAANRAEAVTRARGLNLLR
jgi:DNA-binding CsgD family transcriptional regulator